MIGDTREKLALWGQWTRMGGDATGTEYKSPSLILLRTMVGGVVGLPDIPDEVPSKIDRIVARLKQRDAEMYLVLRHYHVDTRTKHAIAKIMRSDRMRVARVLDAAEHWVDGVLDANMMVTG